MNFSSTGSMMQSVARTWHRAIPLHSWARAQSALAASLMLITRHRRTDIYNILWAVVFGFATLNILTLAARRFEPNRRGLTFGELMAVLVVLISVFLLGWEMLGVFHIFPIKLQR
jgi:hypothetical protein